jgi:hypothetical protein
MRAIYRRLAKRTLSDSYLARSVSIETGVRNIAVSAVLTAATRYNQEVGISNWLARKDNAANADPSAVIDPIRDSRR